MTEGSKSKEIRFGFLTAIETTDQGWVGGLLMTTRTGRPLEFQCTTPVKANKTQEILYGETLQPFLLGELIGKTLLDRANVKPLIVLVDRPEILELRQHVSIPVLHLIQDEKNHREMLSNQFEIPHGIFTRHEEFSDDERSAEKMFAGLPEQADLGEPLFRVGEALKETLRNIAA